LFTREKPERQKGLGPDVGGRKGGNQHLKITALKLFFELEWSPPGRKQVTVGKTPHTQDLSACPGKPEKEVCYGRKGFNTSKKWDL